MAAIKDKSSYHFFTLFFFKPADVPEILIGHLFTEFPETAALMIDAFAGRMKFSAMLVFMVTWSICVYSPICHWVWAEGGYFFDMGALDYAGSTVVHFNAGISGLVACLVLGKRLGYGREPMSPHNLTFAMLGAAILWIGWFGFNGGSGLASNERAVMAILVTQIAAAAAGISWMAVEAAPPCSA